jgi:transketolase
MTLRIDNSPTIKSRRHPLDRVCINTIRTLAIDAIQAANSGHPGTPMAMAPVGYYLWQYVLRFDPHDPIWPNRDRFVLSAGHALCGDGCMMEGISSEAASLAAHWKLSNLCWIYDNNHITIEGNTALAFSEDVATRFLGYGWNVTRVGDANDLDVLDRAFAVFIGMRSFGASAPLKDLQREFGFTVDRVVDAAKDQLNQLRK